MPNPGTSIGIVDQSSSIPGLWPRLSALGVSDADSSYFARKILISNKVSVILFSTALTLGTGFFLSGVPSATFRWFLSLMIGLALVPVLNHLRLRNLSRHVLSTALPLFLIGFVAHVRYMFPESVHGASFIIPRFFLIGISFLPLILFGFDERKHLIGSFSLNMLLLLFFNEILDLFGGGLGVAEPMIADPFFISICSVSALIILSTGYFFLSRLNTKYEYRIEQLLDETREQNKAMQDAVNYAKNLQQIILPNNEVLHKLSDRLFAFYQPLHTISGDFYYSLQW